MKFVYSLLAGVVLLNGTCPAYEVNASEVTFANSFPLEVKKKINSSITLLHPFEYPETTTRVCTCIIHDIVSAICY